MADSFYKPLDNVNDVINTRTLLHEAIPLTGTIVSGTYNDGDETTEYNIKNFGHGMFQSVYDYPYLSSSANHIFDISVGVGTNSALYSSVTNQQAKKKNIYNQMAQVLMGYDATGSILQFDEDGDIIAGGTKINDGFFLNFSRLLTKDEIKKGSFELKLGVHPSASYGHDAFGSVITIKDSSGSDGFLVNSPAGEYGILFATGSGVDNLDTDPMNTTAETPVGLLFYQAGIALISGSVFSAGTGGILGRDGNVSLLPDGTSGPDGFSAVTASSIQTIANSIRNRIYNLQFNNTVELNSTIYFCRANHNEFNYSTNPTYLSGSKLRVKDKSTDEPVSYITTIGLYSDNNELMAVAKLSEPLKKTANNEFTIRVRLDY
jgi:hypothetical protein